MQAEDLRADYLLGLGDTIEVILPRWVRGAIRADLANRMGVDLLSVTNQRIGDLFAERGVRVQWLRAGRPSTSATRGRSWPTRTPSSSSSTGGAPGCGRWGR